MILNKLFRKLFNNKHLHIQNRTEWRINGFVFLFSDISIENMSKLEGYFL